MKWMAAAALMLAPVLAWAQTGTCPALKNPDMKWNQRQGDNYTLCYIELPGSVSTGFGIYVGHRTFKPDKKAKAEKGAVGTQQVQWYTKATPGNARPYSREAMIVIPGDKPKSKLKVYAWIDAATAEQLSQATAIAKQVALN